jgi:hypothetical protein
MPSAWIERRETSAGDGRYVVKYRLGGRESIHRYAGSFATRREALARRRWVSGGLAARRIRRLGQLADDPATGTLADAAARWRASRVDVTGYRGTNGKSQSRRAPSRSRPFLV